MHIALCCSLSPGSVKPLVVTALGSDAQLEPMRGQLEFVWEIVCFFKITGGNRGRLHKDIAHKNKNDTQTSPSQKTCATIMLNNTQVLCTSYETICLYCLVLRTIEKWVSGVKKNQLQFEQFFSQRCFLRDMHDPISSCTKLFQNTTSMTKTSVCIKWLIKRVILYLIFLLILFFATVHL